MTHSECVTYAAHWVSKRCDVTLPEFFTLNSELPDVIGFRTSGNSIVVECKVSRADFLRDKKKHFRRWAEGGMGEMRYYCCPKGLIDPAELPSQWGLIYIYPSGHIKQIVPALYQARNIKAEHHVLFYYAKRAQLAGVHADILKMRSGL